MAIYELRVISTGKLILYRKSNKTLLEWQKFILPKILTMPTKEEFYEYVQRGDVLAGWKNRKPQEVAELGEVDKGCEILLVKQEDSYGIVLREAGSNILIKGDIKLLKKYKIIRHRHFNETQQAHGKEVELIKIWNEKYLINREDVSNDETGVPVS